MAHASSKIRKENEVCVVCNMRKPLDQMVTTGGQATGLCKECRNRKKRVKSYEERPSLPNQRYLYEVNIDIMNGLAFGIYRVQSVINGTTGDFLIFDKELAVLRTPNRDTVMLYDVVNIAEILTRRNLQVLARIVTKIPGNAKKEWLTAEDILAPFLARERAGKSADPLATLDEELGTLF